MTLAPPSAFPGRVARFARHGPALAVLAACAAFMAFDLRTPPLALWDESRIAVNALEMRLSGHLSLVTTYGFVPDLWNTKPPLLIWLMDLSMSVFGVSVWTLRLPSMLAAIGTLALTLSFARRVTGSFWTGALAAGLLATSIIFFSEHGAHTADYEALLCLFTTGYLYVLFFALHRRRPGWIAPLAAGALIGFAIMTKSVAGLTPGLGVPLYLLLVGRWRRPLQACWLLGAAPLALAPGAAFYALREAAAPGYLHAVFRNDLFARYGQTLERHVGPPWYFLDQLFRLGAFSVGDVGALAPLALLWTRGRARLGLLYSVLVAGSLLLALSMSATKLRHYAAPAAPFLAIATAIALSSGLQTLARRAAPVTLWAAKAVLALLLVASLGRSALFRATWLPAHEFEPEARYGELFRAAAIQSGELHVIDGGVVGAELAAEGLDTDYAPRLDFYRELAASQGQAVTRIAVADLGRQPTGALVGTCDTRLSPAVRALGEPLVAPPGCALVRRR